MSLVNEREARGALEMEWESGHVGRRESEYVLKIRFSGRTAEARAVEITGRWSL